MHGYSITVRGPWATAARHHGQAAGRRRTLFAASTSNAGSAPGSRLERDARAPKSARCEMARQLATRRHEWAWIGRYFSELRPMACFSSGGSGKEEWPEKNSRHPRHLPEESAMKNSCTRSSSSPILDGASSILPREMAHGRGAHARLDYGGAGIPLLAWNGRRQQADRRRVISGRGRRSGTPTFGAAPGWAGGKTRRSDDDWQCEGARRPKWAIS